MPAPLPLPRAADDFAYPSPKRKQGPNMVEQRQTIEIVSVNVGMPSVLLSRPFGDIVSGIDKRPVAAPSLRLTTTNLEGDGQSDTKESRFGGQVHGGPDQAVYAFPAEHYPRFAAAMGRPASYGLVGENLTLRGVTEAEVCIGDVWEWGEALVQVSVPRSPCYKLGIRLGRQSLRGWVRREGLVGWYLRVLRPGIVPTTGQIVVAQRHPAGVSVLAIHRAIDGGGVGPAHLQHLEPLAMKARNKLKVAGRDLTGGVPENDEALLSVQT
jgi:MOSC domain-containing protein YiiM